MSMRWAWSGRDEIPRGTRLAPGTVGRVWGFARAYRAHIVAFLALIGISSLLGAATPLLIRELIDTAIPRRDGGLINLIALAAVALALLGAALTIAQRWFSARIGEGLIYDLRTALFDHVQRQPLAFFTHTQTGALISRMNNDVVGAQRALTGTLGSVTSDVIGLVSTLVVMLALDWTLTLLSLVLLPVFVLPAKRVGRRLQAITRESMKLNAAMNTTMSERFNVAGALLVSLFGRREEELAEFSGRAARVRDIGVRSAMFGRIFYVGLGLVGAVGTAVVYWLGAHQVLAGTLSVGTVVAFAAYLGRIYGPLTNLTSARVDVMTAFVSFERVFEVLDHRPAIEDAPGAVGLERPPGRADGPSGLAIEFDRVRFRYPGAAEATIASLLQGDQGASAVRNGDAPDGGAGGDAGAGGEGEEVLRDVSFALRPGELVALVGPSGAGKTTIAMLVGRVYDATGGMVRVGGKDVRTLTLASLRRAIGVVTQDPHLFHDTVLANLRYARPEATMEEIRVAARAARIAGVIDALPDGYETVVGDRGYRLSGGEKQRLAIARLLLADPAIVILDEATAHLDSESEAEVQAALAEALAGRTSLVIAHRLSTIVRADRILVVEDGRITEQGRHDALLAAGGRYAALYATQAGLAASPSSAGAPALR
jgi:ATP-binding cassette subfamily B protein